MEIRSFTLNNTARAFASPGPEKSPLARAWGAQYVSGTWIFPGYYPFGLWAMRDLRKLAVGARWTPDALALAADIEAKDRAWESEEAAWARGEPCLADVPGEFFPDTFQPFKYQRYGVSRIRHWARTFLLWDMGTGKTRTTLDALRVIAREAPFKKALVVGPPVVLPGWARETGRVSRGEWKGVYFDGTEESWEAAKSAQVVGVSYARARLMANTEIEHPQFGKMAIFAPERSRLLERGYDVIVADESHRLGNWKSEQTQAVVALSVPAPRRIALTGTPGDTPEKLYGQLYFLSPALVPMDYEKFVDKYVTRSPYNAVIRTGYKNLNEMNAIVDSVALRMKKKDCLDLPAMTVVDVPFELGTRQKHRYNELVSTMQATLDPALEAYAAHFDDNPEPGLAPPPAQVLFNLPHGAALVNKLLQVISGFLIEAPDRTICDACPRMEVCVEERIKPYTKKCLVVQQKPPRKVLRDFENPKREVFKDLLEQILEEDDTNKVLCWGVFDDELDDMMGVCAELGVKVERLDGDTTKDVERIELAVQEDPKTRVLVGMVSAGIGINLPAANYSVFYSLPWAPLDYQQAIERNNRPGQKRKMTCYRLLTAEGLGGLDRMVAGVLRFKDRVAFTMTEKIRCASCPRMEACALDGTVPFRENCTYAAAVNRPVAKPSLL